MLADAGETLHPASASLANESRHIEHESGEHDLHAFEAIRRMDELLVANFMVFAELVAEQRYDLVIGDEAWDVDYHLHENPALKRFPFAWMTDFVGWLPMPDADERERMLTADYNAEMLEHRARGCTKSASGPCSSATRTTSSTPDVRTRPAGDPRLDRAELRLRRLRHRFRPAGLRSSAPPIGPGSGCTTVSGCAWSPSAVRVSAVRCCAACWMRCPPPGVGSPGCGSWWSTGPRIDPATLPGHGRREIVGYQPDLTDILAAADIAVVQGGLTTCMELTACRTRFLYVPLRHHFEQNFHVRHRLERYRAGRSPALRVGRGPRRAGGSDLAELARDVDYLPVQTDGAARAARLLADLF